MGAVSNGKRSIESGQLFTLPQLAELSGIDSRSLHNWIVRGLLHPSHERANGAGTTNLFNTRDAFQARVLGELRRSGVELRVLERVAQYMRDEIESLNKGGFLLITDQVQVVPDAADLPNQLGDSGPAVVYKLKEAFDLI